MSRLQDNLPLLVGVVTSALVHVVVLLPLLVVVMSARSERALLAVTLQADDFRPPDAPEEEPEVVLGIESSEASTMTWIGYETYEEHIAQLAKNEQAAFTETPGDVPVEPRPAPAPVPAVEPAPEAVPPPPSLITELLTRLAAAVEQAPLLAQAAPEAPLESPLPPAAESPATETPPAEPVAEPTPAEPAAPTPAGDPGEVADKDSPPTSVEVTLDELKTGRPIAAEGLEIKTRRPDFTTLQRLTQSPRNPLAEIEFDATGKVRNVTLVESTGSNVDESLISSLYRWRATGKRIEAIGRGRTLKIRIRIFL